MWVWLPEELLQRIAQQLIAGKSASELRVVAVLDRRSCAIAKVHLDNMKALLKPPFSLSARKILGADRYVRGRFRIQAHDMQSFGAGVASGALASLETLYLGENGIL